MNKEHSFKGRVFSDELYIKGKVCRFKWALKECCKRPSWISRFPKGSVFYR